MMKLLTNKSVLLGLLIVMSFCLSGYKLQANDDEEEGGGEQEDTNNQDEESSGNGMPAPSDDDTESLKTERVQAVTKQPVVVSTGSVNLDDPVSDQQNADDVSDANDNEEETSDDDNEDNEESDTDNDSSQTNQEEQDTEQVKQQVFDVSSTIVTPPFKSSRSKLLAIISKPGILAGIVGGAIIGILTAILLIMFIVYRMRKKDEGSYALEETKKPLNAYDYRHCPTKEFYA